MQRMTHVSTKPGRLWQVIAATLALAAMLPSIASTPAEAKPPSSPPAISESRVYTSEESRKLGDAAQRAAEAKQRSWDLKMKAVGSSICTGC